MRPGWIVFAPLLVALHGCVAATDGADPGGGADGPAGDDAGRDAGAPPDDAGSDIDDDTDAGTAGPDAGAPDPPPCPWGALLPADPAVGLAEVVHRDAPTELEAAVLARMNEQRDGAPLAWSDCLGDLARSHAHDQVARGYYGHGTAGDPSTFMIVARAASAGFAADGSLDEDVLQGDLHYWLLDDIGNAVDMWMSDGHRIPILGCEEVGIGVAEQPFLDTTIVFVVADFACR